MGTSPPPSGHRNPPDWAPNLPRLGTPLGGSTFLLSGRSGSVHGVGRERTFATTQAAAAALHSRSCRGIVGALPFDLDDPAALWEPADLTVSAQPLAPAAPPQRRSVTVLARLPEPAEHQRRVGEIVARIRAGQAQKVVLARAVQLQVDEAIDPIALAAAFAGGNTANNAFAVALDAAGERYAGQWLVGASPELLVRRRGRSVQCRPYAGTAPRSPDPVVDEQRAAALRSSAKDLAEHSFVVEYLRRSLAPFCTTINAPTEPTLLSTGELWHLATPISATLADPATTALDLALALSPTPALGGTPSAVASEMIAHYEGDRGFYGGAIGWCNSEGDGDWVVTIRCVGLAADLHHLTAWAGGGIIADSDPAAEVAETTAKFATALRALGADPETVAP
ncbi:isochorismate synthase [Gordonia defluvii]|uniref:isochorismate synthase n=1 Tax=Gordonia defluvii TaxID=283718 RepID=A0ABP6L5Z6_9ACTN|nr:isochorismate synthase [Gordonia sp. UBA5067]